MKAPIDIPPLDIKMTEHSSTIFYLSSSMRPSGNIPSESSPVVSLDLPSAITLGSTSVDPLSTYSSVTPCDDMHVNPSSDDDELGSFAVSGGLSSTSHPIFYHDDDIMEELPTLGFIYSPLHRTHAFVPHTPCGHYTHLFPHLKDFCTSLAAVCQFEAKRNKSTSPIFSCFAST